MPFTLFFRRESSSAIPAFLPEAKIIESKTQSPSSHTPPYSGRPPARIAPFRPYPFTESRCLPPIPGRCRSCPPGPIPSTMLRADLVSRSPPSKAAIEGTPRRSPAFQEPRSLPVPMIPPTLPPEPFSLPFHCSPLAPSGSLVDPHSRSMSIMSTRFHLVHNASLRSALPIPTRQTRSRGIPRAGLPLFRSRDPVRSR